MASRLIALALFLQSFLGAATALADSPPRPAQLLYNSDVFKLYYQVIGKSVYFSATLPAKWSYELNIDGDRDGVWGHDPYSNMNAPRTSKDVSFGQTRDGQLCPQYIWAAQAQDPNQIYASSECGAFHSGGTMRTQLLFDNRAIKTYVIPLAALPTKGGLIPIVVTLWDGKKTHYLQTLAHPILLKL